MEITETRNYLTVGRKERTPDSDKEEDRHYADSIVTQSRSIYSPEDAFVYGNPKEGLRRMEKLGVNSTITSFDQDTSVLDLSCKLSTKTDPIKKDTDNETYHNCRRNLTPGLDFLNKKPTTFQEQLQIAKLQHQQRRAAQKQQKLLQQMRRTLDKSEVHGGKVSKHCEHSDVSGERKKDERIPSSSYFNVHQYPYHDPVPCKELPDGHPILPLFDPVYFSALYNAHGYLPPSSPSIAAAFISTLHEILPKLPSMLPSSPPKTNDHSI